MNTDQECFILHLSLIFPLVTLQPDIAAPGESILAAWAPISPISGFPGDDRVTSYSVLSGTSMACPHATGVAAYVKSFHPNWSPAAIQSALVTTGRTVYKRDQLL